MFDKMRLYILFLFYFYSLKNNAILLFLVTWVLVELVMSLIPYYLRGMDIAHYYLDGNTDAVEFCPCVDYSHILAVSTYTLQEGDNPSRSGSISLFNVNADTCCFKLLHRVEASGVFDIKWDPVGSGTGFGPLLAQADSSGCIRIHHLESSSGELENNGMCG